jgi:hypothetical protein
MNVCPRFTVFVLSCVGRGLRSGPSLIKGVLPTIYMVHKFHKIYSESEQAKKHNPSNTMMVTYLFT